MVVYARRYPRHQCSRDPCPLAGCTILAGSLRGEQVHPLYCPAETQQGEVVKRLRKGKKPVLPRERLPSSGIEVIHGAGTLSCSAAFSRGLLGFSVPEESVYLDGRLDLQEIQCVLEHMELFVARAQRLPDEVSEDSAEARLAFLWQQTL